MKQYPAATVTLPSGETMAYRRAGSGENIILIHGNMSSSVHWQDTIRRLEADYTVYAPDMRGFGDSSYNKGFDSLRELACDIGTFADIMGLDNYTLIGWSAGGGVAMELAAERPNQVKRLILLETAPVTGYPMFKKDASGKPILTAPLMTKEDVAEDPVQVLPALNAFEDRNAEFFRYIWNLTIYNQHQPSSEDYEIYLEAILKQRCLVDLDYALLTFNMTDTPTFSAQGSGRMALIACPVAMIHGMKDMVVPYDWVKATAEHLRSSLHVLENCGHSPMTDDPELFYATLKEILAR